MENYELKLKEALVDMRLDVLSEYINICTGNGVASDLVSLSNDVISFSRLCKQARNYYNETRRSMSAYSQGTYSVSGDQTTADYLEKIKIRYDVLLNKIRRSGLTAEEQSNLLTNIVIDIGDNGSGYFVFIPKSEAFLHGIIKELNDKDLLAMYDTLNDIKYAYISDIKSIVESRGLQAAKPKKSGGCYVATCVYGSYDCPEVWTLRRFRDNILAENVFGRLFIKLYYAVSPTAVRLFGKYSWFHKLFKAPLDSLVEKLIEGGVENTPYSD